MSETRLQWLLVAVLSITTVGLLSYVIYNEVKPEDDQVRQMNLTYQDNLRPHISITGDELLELPQFDAQPRLPPIQDLAQFDYLFDALRTTMYHEGTKNVVELREMLLEVLDVLPHHRVRRDRRGMQKRLKAILMPKRCRLGNMFNLDTERKIKYFYGDFFRTSMEQKKIEKNYFRYQPDRPAKSKNTTDPSKYNYICPNVTAGSSSRPSPTPRNSEFFPGPAIRRKRSSQGYASYIEEPRHHACCTSQRKFVSPPTAYSDHDGSLLRLVRLGDEWQYFLSEDCQHNYNCEVMCSCYQLASLHRALVYNPYYQPAYEGIIPQYIVQTIRLDGPCKCMNGE